MKQLNQLLLCILISLLYSCENVDYSPKSIDEGIINFNISYPVKNYASYMERVIPKKMTMSFKDNVYKNEVSVGNFFTSSVITDCNTKKMVMLLNLHPEKIYTTLNKKQVEQMLEDHYPIPEIITSPYKDSVMGVICKRHYGVFDQLKDGRDVLLNETKAIKIKNSNWGNQFSHLKGVLTNYEVAQFGLNMQFKAYSYEKTSIADSCFSVPNNYEEVTFDVYWQKMNEIFAAFLI